MAKDDMYAELYSEYISKSLSREYFDGASKDWINKLIEFFFYQFVKDLSTGCPLWT